MTFGGKIMASAGSCFLLFSYFVLSFCSGVLQTEAQKQSGLGNTRRPQQRVYIYIYIYIFTFMYMEGRPLRGESHARGATRPPWDIYQ